METVTIVLSGSKRISWENVLRFSGSGPPGSRAPGASPTSDTRALRRRPALSAVRDHLRRVEDGHPMTSLGEPATCW